jgi:hypothetical protein
MSWTAKVSYFIIYAFLIFLVARKYYFWCNQVVAPLNLNLGPVEMHPCPCFYDLFCYEKA